MFSHVVFMYLCVVCIFIVSVSTALSCTIVVLSLLCVYTLSLSLLIPLLIHPLLRGSSSSHSTRCPLTLFPLFSCHSYSCFISSFYLSYSHLLTLFSSFGSRLFYVFFSLSPSFPLTVPYLRSFFSLLAACLAPPFTPALLFSPLAPLGFL